MSRLVRLCATLSLLAATASAHAARIPLIGETCDLATLGVTAPTGISHSAALNFMVTDNATDQLVFTDASCAALGGDLDLAALGITDPQGVGNNLGGQIAVVDGTAAEVVFTNPAGAPLGSCDTAALGATRPTGIGWDASRAAYAVVDADADVLALIDTSEMGGGPCNVVQQFQLAPLGALDPSAVVWLSDLDAYAITDDVADAVLLAAPNGALVDQFDTLQGFGAGDIQGVVYGANQQKFTFVDRATARLIRVDARGSSQVLCPTPGADASGITVHPITEELIIVDRVARRIDIVDGQSCAVNRTIDVSVWSGDPTGVAYVPAVVPQLVFTDGTSGEIHFMDYASEQILNTCDGLGSGLQGLSGIDFLPGLGWLAVTTTGDDGWAVLDQDCELMHVRSAGTLERSNAPTRPEGITYQFGLGTFLIADADSDEVYLSDFEGLPERQFDLGGLGIGEATALTCMPVSGDVFAIVEGDQDLVYQVTVPALLEATALTGRFRSQNATAYFIMRGRGRFTGTLEIGQNQLAVFGHYNRATNKLALGGLPNNGGPVSVLVDVEPDLSTIYAPNPIGTLVRDF